MRELAKRVSLSLPAPIQIDSTEPDVMKRALEQTPGRAIVNSVNLEAGRDKLDTVRAARQGPRRGADRADHRRGRHGQDARAQARDRPAPPRADLRRARARPRAADLRRPDLHAHHRRRGVAAVGRRDDRGHPADQEGDPRRQDLAGRVQRVLRRVAQRAPRAQLGVPAPLRRGRPGPGDGAPGRGHALPGDPGRRARAHRRPGLRPARGRARAVHRPLRVQGRGGRGRGRRPHGGHGARGGPALAHPAAQEGGRGGLDRPLEREDRRRAHPQRGAAARDEGGGRQVRRRRADPAVRAPVGRGHEARGGAARELPRPDRGPHQGQGGDRHRVRRRPRHRQVAGEHDPHQQRLHRDRPRQAGAGGHDHQRRGGQRGGRHRPVGAAGVDLQADADLRAGAALARPRVPRAGGRGRHQPRLRPPDALPGRQGVGRRLRARRLLLQGRLPGPRHHGRAGRRRRARQRWSRRSGRRPRSCARSRWSWTTGRR